MYPDDLRCWLLTAGYGDFNEDFAIRHEWLSAIDRGSAPEFAFLASDFFAFLGELERHSFNIVEWVGKLDTAVYDW